MSLEPRVRKHSGLPAFQGFILSLDHPGVKGWKPIVQRFFTAGKERGSLPLANTVVQDLPLVFTGVLYRW